MGVIGGSLIEIFTDLMVSIILIVAVCEFFLYVILKVKMLDLSKRLKNSLDNMLHGVDPKPEKDDTRKTHDEISALLDTIETIQKKGKSEELDKLNQNIRNHDRRRIDSNTYQLDVFSNVTSAIVQIFPLLGILGTILAIGKSMLDTPQVGDTLNAIIQAFSTALNTTMLGLLFAVIFMIVDAKFQASLQRIKQETIKYRDVIRYFYINKV